MEDKESNVTIAIVQNSAMEITFIKALQFPRGVSYVGPIRKHTFRNWDIFKYDNIPVGPHFY